MRLFHRHRWVQQVVTFTPPVTRHINIKNSESEVFERALYGFTTVTLCCSECGILKNRKITGKIEL